MEDERALRPAQKGLSQRDTRSLLGKTCRLNQLKLEITWALEMSGLAGQLRERVIVKIRDTALLLGKRVY
jgi:hypothetical protein